MYIHLRDLDLEGDDVHTFERLRRREMMYIPLRDLDGGR